MFANSAFICGNRSNFRNKTNVPTKFTLQIFVRRIHGIFEVESAYISEHAKRFVSGIQEHTDTELCVYQCTVWPRNF